MMVSGFLYVLFSLLSALLLFFLQSHFCFFNRFAVFCQKLIHEGIFDFFIFSYDTFFNFLISADCAVFNFFVSSDYFIYFFLTIFTNPILILLLFYSRFVADMLIARFFLKSFNQIKKDPIFTDQILLSVSLLFPEWFSSHFSAS